MTNFVSCTDWPIPDVSLWLFGALHRLAALIRRVAVVVLVLK